MFLTFVQKNLNKASPIPLYKQLVNLLESYIASGMSVTGQRLPTESELEEVLGISRVTIRQAMKAAVDAGLVIRSAGKGTFFAATESNTLNKGFIGYIVHHLTSSFNIQMLTAAELAINGSGYHLIFGNSGANLEQENMVLKGLGHRNLLGFIVQPVMGSQPNRELTRIVNSGQPLILIDREIPGVTADLVTADHFSGGRLTTQHLLEQGFTKIVYLCMDVMHLSSVAGRYSGYCAAMQQAGLTPRPAFQLSSLGEIGYNEILQGIPEENATVDGEIAAFLLSPDRPEAIIAVNDAIALMVIKIARQLNINIPGDLALVGYDNLKFTEGYGLTTVDQHADRIGKEAVRLLVKRISGDRRETERLVVPVELVIRASSQKCLARSTL